VLAHAGCSLHRDAVDTRLIDAVNSFGKTGQIIHTEISETQSAGEKR